MSYEQFCLLFRANGSSFCSAGHAKAYSRNKNADNFVRKTNPKGATDFAPIYSKYLNIATVMPYVLFTNIHQKSARAEMHITHDDTPSINLPDNKGSNGIVKSFIALLMMFPIIVWAENEQEVLRLEKALMRVQQEAQAVHQQFLMIQELRRNEIQGSPLADLPGATVQSTPIPKYEEMMQRQQEKKDRVEQLTTDLDRLYLQFNELNDERQSLMEQIKRLEQQPEE